MTTRDYIIATDKTADTLLEETEKRTDIQGLRLQRLLALPDLSRKEGSPIKFIVDAVLGIDMFKNFDVMQFPEIVSVKNNFDLRKLHRSEEHTSELQSQ